MRVRTAVLALVAEIEDVLVAMSMARNISDRNVGKSSSLRVGRCLGFIEMVPVVGSITIFWRPESEEEITMPLVEPGAAIYGSLLGSGVRTSTDIGANLGLRRHLRTRISSWLNDHSSAASRVSRGGVGVGGGECATPFVWLWWFCTLGVTVLELDGDEDGGWGEGVEYSCVVEDRGGVQ